MLNRRPLRRLRRDRGPVCRRDFHRQHCDLPSRYAHIIAPTRLHDADHGALCLAFALASFHQSKLTVLHAQSPLRDDVRHGLDAIGLLHEAVGELKPAWPPIVGTSGSRLTLSRFVENVVCGWLREGVDWRGECRSGEVADVIATYANETAADLLVLSSKPRRWWLPLVPATIRAITRRVSAQVIVIGHQMATFAR